MEGAGKSKLQLAVQSVEWSYCVVWRLCSERGILVWGDGYYNGPIKTTKTLHPTTSSTPMESNSSAAHHHVHSSCSTSTLSLRTHQLRDLYESLSTGTPSPSPALSPEDLTHSEWFYLLCISFSFPPGIGLPGHAFATNKHVWITAANHTHTKFFSRALLAKSARIKTVVCIPLMDAVVELGTTDKVKEDIGFIQHIKSIFAETESVAPKPALSELSTSNSSTSLEHCCNINRKQEDDMDSINSDTHTSAYNNIAPPSCPCSSVAVGEPSELMQLELSEDIRLGSPDNDIDADFHLLPNSEHLLNNFEYRPPLKHPLPPPGNSSAAVAMAMLTEEDTHYSSTVSAILQNQNSSSSGNLTCSTQSAFSNWNRPSDVHHVPMESATTSQCLLKHILRTLPFLHTKHHHNPSKSCDGRWHKRTSQDQLSGNHSLAETRRHRENLPDKFIVLRSIVPFATKMDKASILGDTVEYLKQLRQKIQDLEAQNRELEISSRRSGFEELQRNAAAAVYRTRYDQPCLDKRKLRIFEGAGDGCIKHKVLNSPTSLDSNLQVSIIGSEGLLELHCPYKEGLLLDILLILQGLRIETTAVRSTLSDGVFIAELRAKVKENADGKKASILEVKRAIQQIVPRTEN